MFKCFVVKMDLLPLVTVILLITQGCHCKKPVTAMGATTTAKITKFLDDMTDFLTDVLYSISTFIGLSETEEKSPQNHHENEVDPNANSNWGLQNFMRYTMSTFKSGYKMVKDSIPVLQMARENVESVSLVLPVNVSLATIVEHILLNLTPELMKVDEENDNDVKIIE